MRKFADAGRLTFSTSIRKGVERSLLLFIAVGTPPKDDGQPDLSYVEKVAEEAAHLPGVVHAASYKYMCSDPGQELIKSDIKEQGLNRIVVASCSPRLHEQTFRQTLVSAGLNPYLFEMANIREHCSWVIEDKAAATEKAKSAVSAAVRRVFYNEPLDTKVVKVNPQTLIVGAGIAGIQAALEIANSGYKVILVEREPSIGGHMAQLDKTFPTLDCSA